MCCYSVGKRQNHRSVGERWPGGRKKVSDSVPVLIDKVYNQGNMVF